MEEFYLGNFCEEEKSSNSKNMNQYWYQSYIYLGCPSIFCGCFLQAGYDLHGIYG